MKYSPKQMWATQKDLAMTSGTGLRFIIELEQGKPTSQIGKVLTVLNTLGVKMDLTRQAGGQRERWPIKSEVAASG